ncbi:MAG: hypothetical protein VX498_11495, partial [Myxococcota bacterium]|nr:hypothetical protein [Myxococcota bacterium]
QLVDCLDPDCAGVFHCTWPDEVAVETQVQFLANELAESFGVGDCSIEFGGVLTLDSTEPGCPGCDREYSGSVTVSSGDCPEDYIEPPVEASYGFVFLNPSEREVWKYDFDEGLWESFGIVVGSGSTWLAEQDSPVLYDVPILGETEVGSFTILATLTDL